MLLWKSLNMHTSLAVLQTSRKVWALFSFVLRQVSSLLCWLLLFYCHIYILVIRSSLNFI
jgi:hypothetical protein